MSCSYADGLSPYDNKGKLGLKEVFDSSEEIRRKAQILADWIKDAKHVVFHTGAGISTSAGIPDFRGPNGVWTLEAKGLKPTINMSFDEAQPTFTHMAILTLINSGKAKYIVSQNIDGLHLRSGLPRKCLAELHGNMFIEQCSSCQRQYVMEKATKSVGQKPLGRGCRSGEGSRGRPCRGSMTDTILDWEASLPERDLDMADYHSSVADLNICLGTTLQIVPSGNLPLKHKKITQGKLVICNLQPTKHDKKADLVINGFVDEVMVLVMQFLDMETLSYKEEDDPTKNGSIPEWTIQSAEVAAMKTLYRKKLGEVRKSVEMNGSSKKSKIKAEKKETIEQSSEEVNEDKEQPLIVKEEPIQVKEES